MESLGSARLDIVVDTTQFQASIERAKNIASGLGKEAASAFQASDEKAKRAASSLIRYTEMMGKSVEQQRLLRAGWAGTDTKILVEAERRMVDYANATEAAASAQRKLAADQAFMRQLQQTAMTAGKTRSEILELQAAELGLTNQAAPLIAQLRAQERAMNGVGREAKQMQWAMRGLPAQITDITVSLAGGQNPLMVLLQQGGQLKDMFGGIRPAATALASSIAGMVNPLTIAAAGVTAFGVALISSDNKMAAFTLSLARSGNTLRMTAADMRSLAESIGSMDGVTQGGAEDALNRIATGGRIAADQLSDVAKATAAWASVSGDSVDEVVRKFEDIAKDPVDALLKLNDAEHFLTEAQIERILQLKEEGKEQQLVKEAVDIYADTITGRAKDVEQALSNIAQLWRDIKDVTSTAWTEFMGFADWSLGVYNRMSANTALAVKRIWDGPGTLESYGAVAKGFMAGLDNSLNYEPPKPKGLPGIGSPAVNSADVRARQQAADNMKRYQQDVLNPLEAQIAKEKKIREDGAKAKWDSLKVEEIVSKSRAEFNEREAKRNKPKKGPSMRAVNNADLRADLQQFKDVLQTEQSALSNSRKITEAEYNAKLISMEEYYRRSRQSIQADVASQEKALVGQINTLRTRNATGADAINNQRQLAQLEAELARIRAEGATELQVLSIREQQALREREQAYKDFANVIDRTTNALRADWDAQIARITLSERDYRIQQSLTAVYREQTEALDKLNAAKERGEFKSDPGEFERRRAAINAGAKEQERVVREGYERQRVAQADWLNGVAVGLQNWMDMTADAAGQASQITNRAMEGASDLLTTYLTTGQADVKAFLRMLLTEITNFLIKQAVVKFAAMIATMWGNSGSGGITTVDSGADMGNVAAKGAWFDGRASYFAKGGAFTNTIVDRATPFMFNKGGSFGVMGEAGPEAIMPLKRGPSGKLGVEMHGGGGSVVVNVNTTINSDGSRQTNTGSGGGEGAYRQFAQEVGVVVERHIDRAMMPNGKLWQAGVRAG